MRILKKILLVLLGIFGILLATPNMEAVTFFYFPPSMPYAPYPEGLSLDLPLAVLVLAGIALGALFVGSGTLVEHVRLRSQLRKANKQVLTLEAKQELSEGEMEQLQRRADEAEARLADADSKATNASQSQSDAELRAQDAELRARKAEERLAAAEAEATPAPETA